MEMPKYYFSGEFAEFESLLQELGARQAVYEPGNYLARAEEWAGKCFYVQKGIHVLTGLREEGKDSLMMLFGPGSIYPFCCEERELFQELFLSSRAVSRVEALVLSREQLSQAVRRSSDLALVAIRQHCEMEHTLFMQRLFHSGGASRFKVGSFLYLYSQANPETGDGLWLTQENIAGAVDLSRMQVFRVLQELRQLGLIRTGRHRVQVVDLEGLESWCMEQMEQ